MKIEPNNISENQGLSRSTPNVQKSPGIGPNAKAGDVKSGNQTDMVDISARSKEIADLMSAVNQLPDVREKKVQEIKQSVQAGTYTIDPGKIAEKILKEL
jgi:negative regulator of flagellin synthesis FlgM